MKSFTRIIVSTKPQSETVFPPSPNFDDEATLLMARPVVPIKKAFNLGSVRSYLGTGIIIVAAAIAGAMAAVSTDYFQNHRHSEAAIAVAPSAPTGDEGSEISQTPAPTPRSSAAIFPHTMTPAETDLNLPAPIDTRETKPATNDNQFQKKVQGNERVVERTIGVEKRSGPTEQQRHVAKVHSSVDSTQTRRQRDAGSIREIFEGPSPF
ncbi:MAG TPA: hypothetical protein VGJ55_13770 [Pyrinomonadaceae bacterium]